MRFAWMAACLFCLALAACAPQPGAPVTPADTQMQPPAVSPGETGQAPLLPGEPTPTAGVVVSPPSATSAAGGEEPTPAAAAAARFLARKLGIQPESIQLVTSEAREWRDGCLGLARPNQYCIQESVPGYRVVLSAGGKEYILRTNQDGTVIRQEE